MKTKIPSRYTKYQILYTSFGFTLVELLVVITIIGILATIGLVAFNSAQARSRDAQRKSDLKEIGNALELFYSDYGRYPDSTNGQIYACSYNSATGVGAACAWGTGEFRDVDGSGNTKTTYFKVLPGDKIAGHAYYYRAVTINSVPDSGYQIYAHLENLQDQSIITTNASCGTVVCNFAVTSPNITPQN